MCFSGTSWRYWLAKKLLSQYSFLAPNQNIEYIKTFDCSVKNTWPRKFGLFMSWLVCLGTSVSRFFVNRSLFWPFFIYNTVSEDLPNIQTPLFTESLKFSRSSMFRQEKQQLKPFGEESQVIRKRSSNCITRLLYIVHVLCAIAMNSFGHKNDLSTNLPLRTFFYFKSIFFGKSGDISLSL